MIPSRFPDPGEGDEMDRAWDRYKDGLSGTTIVEEALEALRDGLVMQACSEPWTLGCPYPRCTKTKTGSNLRHAVYLVAFHMDRRHRGWTQ